MSWDFALILFTLLVITGIIWSLDFFYLRSRRRAAGVSAMAKVEHSVTGLSLAEATKIRQQAYDKAAAIYDGMMRD